MADQRFHLTNLHPMRTRIPEETQGISRSGNGTPLGSRLFAADSARPESTARFNVGTKCCA